MSRNAIDAYSNVKVESASYADPHQLISMLMSGAIQRLVSAKAALRAKQYAEKNRLLRQTINIIDGLQNCLDREVGGELAENLDALYDYMKRRLSGAFSSYDETPMEEVRSLMSDIYGAWSEIPADVRQQHASGQQPTSAAQA